MKKRAIIAFLLFIIFMFSAIPVNAEVDVYKLGDIDNNREVDVSDYLLIKRSCLKTYELNSIQKVCADIDENGVVDTKDYILVKRYCLNTFKFDKLLGGCDFADAVEGKSKHDYTEKTISPTCTEPKYIEHTCKICGFSYRDITGSALGHTWGTCTVTKIPTYTVAGEHLLTCSVCDTKSTISIGCLTETDYNIRQEILKLVNIERQKAGVPALTYNTSAQIALDARAQDLQIKFAHERPDGSRCFAVLNDYNINSFYTLGENIAYGYLTPESVVEAWMDSPGHRANILNPDYTSIAVGEYNYSWVQMFFG